jgi:2-keto-3-deoxy-L-rhamnonate aldolase RhmA
MEHTAIDLDTIKRRSRFAAGSGSAFVRVPVSDYTSSPALDAGAMGIMVPWSKAASKPSSSSRHTLPPVGRRGAAFGSHDGYREATSPPIATANARTMVMALIETRRRQRGNSPPFGHRRAVARAFRPDELHGDSAQFNHPRYLANVDAIVAAANRHGKTAGVLAADVAWGRDYLAKGFRAVAYGVDHDAARRRWPMGIAR